MVRSYSGNIWAFPKIEVPQNGRFIMDNPIKKKDLGVPLFSETPIWPSLLGPLVALVPGYQQGPKHHHQISPGGDDDNGASWFPLIGAW